MLKFKYRGYHIGVYNLVIGLHTLECDIWLGWTTLDCNTFIWFYVWIVAVVDHLAAIRIDVDHLGAIVSQLRSSFKSFNSLSTVHSNSTVHFHSLGVFTNDMTQKPESRSVDLERAVSLDPNPSHVRVS